MAEPEDFFRWVIPSASACPDPIAAAHIIDAARSFCEATRCWRHRQRVTLDGTEADIALSVEDAAIHELERALFDDEELSEITFDASFLSDEGEPRYISQINPATFVLLPGPRAGVLDLSIFLKPAVRALTLPDFLLHQHAQAVAYGALSTILVVPDQPFSNPKLAVYFAQQFEMRKDAGFNLNRRGQQRAPSRTRASYM